MYVFSNCVPVKGARRSAVYDLGHNEYFLIPNDLFNIIQDSRFITIGKIKKKYGWENENIIDEYIEVLLNNRAAILMDKSGVKNLPPITLDWEYPSQISNAILDVGSWCEIYLSKVVSGLNELGCFHVQIRSYSIYPFEFWIKVIENFQDTRITSIEFLITFEEHAIDFWEKQCLLNNRISNVFIHSTPVSYPNKLGNPLQKVFYYNQIVTSEKNCGEICPQYFNINMRLYTESLQFNTCLNRKIAVDQNGNIKNCPSLSNGFGHISKTNLADAIVNENFKSFWGIKKDQVHVCKDCEFRYMCTDCRAYLSNEEDIYSKPLKCGYNPYSAVWEGENPSKFALNERKA